MWGLVAACGWCWMAFMLFTGMRYLDHDSKALRYGLAAILPFFVVHRAVILIIAYFVVQWEATLLSKLLVILLGSFVAPLGLYELIIKRVAVLRVIFGMKAGPPVKVQVAAGQLAET
jgi:glucan biosynthesis protein C